MAVGNEMKERLLSWASSRAPFFGIAGAAIVLLSWMVTNTIANRLASAKAALDRVTTEDSLQQRLSSIRRGYREIKGTLSRVDLLLSEMRPESIFSTFPAGTGDARRTTYALLQSAETSFFEHEDLQETLFAARRLMAAGELPSALNRDLSREIDKAEDLLGAFAKTSAEWDQQRRQAIDLIKAGQSDSDLFQRATGDFIKAALPLQERSVEQREALLKLHGRVLGALSTRHNRLSVAHYIAERLSWLLYVIGTGIAILGKWLESTSR
jgi:hypothetical protein